MAVKQQLYKYSYTSFKKDISRLSQQIRDKEWDIKYVYGLPRGGSVIAVCLSHSLNIKYLSSLDQKHNPNKTLIVDDVSDTGKTLKDIKNINKYKIATLFIKPGTAFFPNLYMRIVKRNVWIVYFWEVIK